MGSKNYFVRIDNNNEVSICVKVRGIIFNRISFLVVNVDVMRNFINESVRVNREGGDLEKDERFCSVLGFVRDSYEVFRFTMKRGSGSYDFFSVFFTEDIREYGVVFDKRFIDW